MEGGRGLQADHTQEKQNFPPHAIPQSLELLTLHSQPESCHWSLASQDRPRIRPGALLAESAPFWQPREEGCFLSPTKKGRHARAVLESVPSSRLER